jgi:hypothetical protein
VGRDTAEADSRSDIRKCKSVTKVDDVHHEKGNVTCACTDDGDSRYRLMELSCVLVTAKERHITTTERANSAPHTNTVILAKQLRVKRRLLAYPTVLRFTDTTRPDFPQSERPAKAGSAWVRLGKSIANHIHLLAPLRRHWTHPVS